MERGNLVSYALGKGGTEYAQSEMSRLTMSPSSAKQRCYMISYRETKHGVKIGTHLEVADPGYRGR